MDTNKHYSETEKRQYDKILDELGDEIRGFMRDDSITDIMLNPDGAIWIDSQEKGQERASELPLHRAKSLIHSVAGIYDLVLTPKTPSLEVHLPVYDCMNGERFTARMPPIVPTADFTIRKRPKNIYSLDDYIHTGRMTEKQATILTLCMKDRKNILVCGGPGSGKTTVTNSLIKTAVQTASTQRYLILEDIAELKCDAKNSVRLLTSRPHTRMRDLVHMAMRMRPDRILVGEVVGSEALDMLKSWNTGCPGGICTVHANGAEEAIQRIIDLCLENNIAHPPINLITQTINVIVSVQSIGDKKGFINEILYLKGYENGNFKLEQAEL